MTTKKTQVIIATETSSYLMGQVLEMCVTAWEGARCFPKASLHRSTG